MILINNDFEDINLNSFTNENNKKYIKSIDFTNLNYNNIMSIWIRMKIIKAIYL